MDITYQANHWILPNGLRLVVQSIPTSKIVVVNTMYHVGSANEDPSQTGIAHLLEHIMCAGSVNIPSYDSLLQQSGGTNNAYTTWDVTSYWSRLPATKLEVGLWIESQRMSAPKFNKHTIDTQRKVVIEEFKQVCLAKPYGDVWHHLLPLAYQEHPYQWPVIGKEIGHIENIAGNNIVQFYERYYHPENAVLSIVGGINPHEAYQLAKKWFASETKAEYKKPKLPQEATQQEVRKIRITGNVPQDAIYMAYKMAGRCDSQYLPTQVLNTILGEGESSWFRVELVEKQKLFNSVQAYTFDTIDPGLLVIVGKPVKGVSLEKAEQYIQAACHQLIHEGIQTDKLTKACHQIEADYRFSQIHATDQADFVAWSTILEDPNFFEREIARLNNITPKIVKNVAKHTFLDKNKSTLYYAKKTE
ncbi:MAG: pitrilysin family protein [Bacteroidota bacterium]